MKLPNDLIKATDYDKAKDRIIKEFECVNDKVIQHYVLGGEHELTMQEIIDCLNALSTIDCDLQTAYAYIQSQNDKIAVLERALKLAGEHIAIKQCFDCPLYNECIYEDACDIQISNYFKSKAESEIKKEQ